MAERRAIVRVNGKWTALPAGDTVAGTPEVYQTASPPVLATPAINFLPVTGYSGLFRQQVNA